MRDANPLRTIGKGDGHKSIVLLVRTGHQGTRVVTDCVHSGKPSTYRVGDPADVNRISVSFYYKRIPTTRYISEKKIYR